MAGSKRRIEEDECRSLKDILEAGNGPREEVRHILRVNRILGGGCRNDGRDGKLFLLHRLQHLQEATMREDMDNDDETSRMGKHYFLGFDVGTQGARIAMLDDRGVLVAAAEEEFPLTSRSREEQPPEMWWEACRGCWKRLAGEVASSVDLAKVRAVAVTSTSGTVIPLGEGDVPLHDALMYSDSRSAVVADTCREAAMRYTATGYTNFNASTGLSKMVWFVGQFPKKAAMIRRWIHAADYLAGKLCGRWDVTDHTSALKSGYDLQKLQWPPYLYEVLPLKREWLPRVEAPAARLGTLLPGVAASFGLPADVVVVAGMTDGCASQVASGAMRPGAWNTTIGTTLVIKGVTRKPVLDPEGRLYNHLHPDPAGGWMPGGASNTGADWITTRFGERLRSLNEKAAVLIPTGHLAWPLQQQGERFPFIAPAARGFEPAGLDEAERFTAGLEGVAFIERCAYEMIEKLSGEQATSVYTAGGGSNSDAWLTIRSNVLDLPVHKMRHATGSVGAAILAAAGSCFDSVAAAAEALTQIEKTVKPDKALSSRYAVLYREFTGLLKEKGYLKA
jgi:sugar (pentulose or hexulose) kinase